jgi:hypothetical protein
MRAKVLRGRVWSTTAPQVREMEGEGEEGREGGGVSSWIGLLYRTAPTYSFSLHSLNHSSSSSSSSHSLTLHQPTQPSPLCSRAARIERVRQQIHNKRQSPSCEIRDELEGLELLGEGSYGKVYKGTWHGTEVRAGWGERGEGMGQR